MNDTGMIEISVGKYEELLDTATRVKVLKSIVVGSKYSIEPDVVARIFDFDMPAKRGDK